ncbi:MAG: DUF1513 domain-containing protein [Sneathiella sp.]
MEINRRTLLKSVASIPVALSPINAWGARLDKHVTTGRDKDGQFYAYILDQRGGISEKIALQGRGHGVAYNKSAKKAVLFARRPGRFALAFNPYKPIKITVFEPPIDRHFYGHGVFSKNGNLLFATENDFDGEKGVIGIYDAQNDFQRLGEFDSGGIGPHEIILSQDGKTLIVANGGIATHPDYPRDKLNLADMNPNLSYISINNEAIDLSLSLDASLHQVSLRHLSIDTLGTVWIGGQYQGVKSDQVPLSFTLSHKDKRITPLHVPVKLQAQMKQYVGSVSVNNIAGLAAMSAPRGNKIYLWNLNSQSLIKTISIIDGCGVAVDEDGFLITSGQGQIVSPTHRSTTVGVNWDNHITAL